jgi:hypothetical protein
MYKYRLEHTFTFEVHQKYIRYILKVPKREIFVTELFILSDPIWV